VLAQLAGHALQLCEGVDLPGQVVEAHRGASGCGVGCIGADREQAEVVVVRRALRLEERRAPGYLVDHSEAERAGVEGDTAVEVAHVEHGVVEPLDRHVSSTG
jgi:hypothetical protein